MKSAIFFLMMIYISLAFLSLYKYVIDLVIDPTYVINHVVFIGKYFIYSILNKTYAFGLAIVGYQLLSLLVHANWLIKTAYVIAVCLLMAFIFNKVDIILINQYKAIKLSIAYCLTGLSVMGINEIYVKKGYFTSRR